MDYSVHGMNQTIYVFQLITVEIVRKDHQEDTDGEKSKDRK